MDNPLLNAVREISAQRDERLANGATIPPERLDALRDVVARAARPSAKSVLGADWLSAIRESILRATAPITRGFAIRVAAACLLLLTSAFPSLEQLRSQSGVAPNAISVSRSDRSLEAEPAFREESENQTAWTSLELERIGFRGTILSLRMGAAELARLQSGLLAQRGTLQSNAFDHLTLAGFDFGSGVLLDAYPTGSHP